MKHIYPRYLGMDGSGDFTWELADGRWTWGENPYEATHRDRTFVPERYVEKYGAPAPMGAEVDRQAESLKDPAELAAPFITVSPGSRQPAGPDPIVVRQVNGSTRTIGEDRT